MAGNAIANSANDESEPAIAFGGLIGTSATFEVAYRLGDGISVIAVGKSGVVASSSVQITTVNADRPDIDFDGTNYLVVWQSVNSTKVNDIVARSYNSSTNAEGAQFNIETNTADQRYPKIKF